MQSPRSHKAKVALAIAIIGALAAWFAARDSGKPAPTPADAEPIREETRERQKPVAPVKPAAEAAAKFDFYLLALSLHPAFCADGHARMPECSGGSSRVLVLHGLWPERLKPGAYPRDCPAPPLALDPGLEAELAEFMPGMRADLHVHEWRKHGGCTGLDDDDYFRRSLAMAREIDSALAARLGTIVKRRAVLAAGTILTGSMPLYDLPNDRVIQPAPGEPLIVPEGAVVVPGTRPVTSGRGAEWGLSVATPIIIKYRDERTSARTALESWIR